MGRWHTEALVEEHSVGGAGHQPLQEGSGIGMGESESMLGQGERLAKNWAVLREAGKGCERMGGSERKRRM